MKIHFSQGARPARWTAQLTLHAEIVHVFSTIGVEGMGSTSNRCVASIPANSQHAEVGAAIRKAFDCEWAVVPAASLVGEQPELVATGLKSLAKLNKSSGNCGIVWQTDKSTFVLSTWHYTRGGAKSALDFLRTLNDSCTDAELGRVALGVLRASQWLNDPKCLDEPDSLRAF